MASGKSTVARHLAAKGAHVIDADRLGHRAYAPGAPGHRQVIEAFGKAVQGKDGAIDRRALGAKVFASPEAMQRLTAIVWPAIRDLAQAEVKAQQAKDPQALIVLEAAVLLEAGWNRPGQPVWVVVAEPAIAIARAMARDGITREAAEQRLAAQLSNAQRIAKADLVLENNGSLAELLAQVDAAHQALAL